MVSIFPESCAVCDGVLSKIHGSDLGFSTDPIDLSHASATYETQTKLQSSTGTAVGDTGYLSKHAGSVPQRCSLDSDRYSHFLDVPRGRSTANEITPFDYGYHRVGVCKQDPILELAHLRT